MSGKVITMKRKRIEKFPIFTKNPTISTESAIAAEETSIQVQLASKRKRLHTIDGREDLSGDIEPVLASSLPNTRNQILIEALQKIVELQNELDAFEHDLDESELQQADVRENAEVSINLDERSQQQENAQRRHEAEALGFAMCARETLKFLQCEGVPTDSLLYKSLQEKLVGQTDGDVSI